MNNCCRSRVRLFPLGALFLVSCSTIHVTRTSDETYREGIRFYRPHPYLLVGKAEKELTARIVYLPDKREEYVIRHVPGIGTSDLAITLEGGWNLTALGHKMDTKVPEMLTAIAGLAPIAGLKQADNQPRGTIPEGLYRIDYDPETGSVSHLTRVGP
jgi:hypothetical protein